MCVTNRSLPTMVPVSAASWFALLCAASVGMTLSNKLLMADLASRKDLVLLAQNAVESATELGGLDLAGIGRRNRRHRIGKDDAPLQ